MHINDDYIAGIHRLTPAGTNSTHFTECCGSAICEDESQCPSCGRLVIGHNAESNHERARIRWQYATAHWSRK